MLTFRNRLLVGKHFPRFVSVKMRILKLLLASLVFIGNVIDNSRFKDRIEQAIWDYVIVFPIYSLVYWYSKVDNAPIDVPIFNVPLDPPHKFIPRKNSLDKLQRMFGSFKDRNGKINIIYVVGNQGTGKTELARQYGNFEFDRDPTRTVIHLNITSETVFKESLVEIHQQTTTNSNDFMRYGNELRQEPITHLVKSLRYLLKKRHNWLLIVDDIKQKSVTEICKTLPQPGSRWWGTGRMIVTTRLAPYDSEHVKIFRTQGLDVEEAKKLLYLVTGGSPETSTSSCIEHIACKLHKSPGDIINVGISMREQRILDKINSSLKMPCYPYKDSDIINNSWKVPGH